MKDEQEADIYGQYKRNELYYYALPDYLKEKYGKRFKKVAIDAGMTCPNRDGSLGSLGCIFCSEEGSGDFASSFYEALAKAKEKGCKKDYIAYFQSFTNTYAPINRLRQIFTQALEEEVFAGISIATRPDVCGEEVIALLEELKQIYQDKFIWVELGLQSIHKKSADFINRAYDLGVFDACVNRLNQIGIEIIVHLIIGLPGESKEEILESVAYLDGSKISGVKLQLLHILKGTRLGRIYQKEEKDWNKYPAINPLSKKDYINLLTEAIGILDERIVIHRLTGDGDRNKVIEPKWSLDKKNVLNDIRKALKDKGIKQGSLVKEYL